MKQFNLLDTTIRDGSYAIDFKFTTSDVENISIGLENAGFEFIEIGHGMGLGASRETPYKALCTDEAYFKAVHKVIKKAKYGMFCIPGIANLDDLKLAAAYGAGFVRIGSNVDEVEKNKPFISEAKRLGLIVAANYMKSYAVTPNEFAEKVKISVDCGADYIYIVDSAGGMFPEEIQQYTEAVRKVSDIKLGFHGHNNLGMAIANSLYCINILGMDIVDVSLCGLGRSAGNAASELLLPALYKNGKNTKIDFYKLLKISKEYIKPLLRKDPFNPLDIICGYAGFHTSYMQYITKCADEYRVNPLKLIVEYCKYDKANMQYDKLCRIASQMPKESLHLSEYRLNDYIGNEQDENI